MNDKNKTEWAWMMDGSEYAHGPFSTREEAIEDARGYISEPTKIGLGVCQYPGPSTFLDIDDIIERLDESAHDNGYDFYDDIIYEFKGDKDDALSDLELWAEKHISVACIWMMEEQETITIEPQAGGQGGAAHPDQSQDASPPESE